MAQQSTVAERIEREIKRITAAGVLVTAIVGGATVWVTWIQKEKEIQIVKEQKDAELRITAAKNDMDRYIAEANVIEKNAAGLSDPSPQKQQIAYTTMRLAIRNPDSWQLVPEGLGKFGPDAGKKFASTQLQQIAHQREIFASVWVGEWSYTFVTTSGVVSGNLKLENATAGVFSGEFSSGGKTIGVLQGGRLNSDGTTLEGAWRNTEHPYWGTFSFTLVSTPNTPRFKGAYALRDSPIDRGATSLWSGTKVK